MLVPANANSVMADAVERWSRVEVERQVLPRAAGLRRAGPVTAPPLRHVQAPSTARHLGNIIRLI